MDRGTFGGEVRGSGCRAALIAACDADAAGLRALRPLTGIPVLEHQVRRLAAAGAMRIVVLLDGWPAMLATAFQRLRADGIVVDAARNIGDAAEWLGGESRLLLLADGCLPDRMLIDALIAAPAPTLAVVEDAAGRDGFERIDADHRWAGLAMLDGAALVDTAAMIGDWDPMSTLLRRTVQQGARRFEAQTIPVMIAQPGALAEAEARLLAQSRERPRGWAAWAIEAPIAEALLPLLFARGLTPVAPGMAAAVLALLGGLLALAGMPCAGLICALPSGILLRIADRLALVQARLLPWSRPLRMARQAGLGAGALGIALALRRGDLQWGWLLLAAVLIVALAIGRRLRVRCDRSPSGDAPMWLARTGAMPWILLPSALGGRWGGGLAIATLYAATSAAWLLWQESGPAIAQADTE